MAEHDHLHDKKSREPGMNYVMKKRKRTSTSIARFCCPSCLKARHAPHGACVIEALADVLVSRGHDPNDVMAWLADQDPQEIWDGLIGPAIDTLERDYKRADPLGEKG